MTPEQIKLVKESWHQISKLDAALIGSLFYNRLFTIAPHTERLFKSPLPEQSKKLVVMIGYIISKLDRLTDIKEEVGRLAARHVHYGVSAFHYIQVGEALLWTLQQGLKDQWTKEIKQAWITCYNTLSSAMIQAANYAEAELI